MQRCLHLGQIKLEVVGRGYEVDGGWGSGWSSLSFLHLTKLPAFSHVQETTVRQKPKPPSGDDIVEKKAQGKTKTLLQHKRTMFMQVHVVHTFYALNQMSNGDGCIQINKISQEVQDRHDSDFIFLMSDVVFWGNKILS